jgi:hypothetical protein
MMRRSSVFLAVGALLIALPAFGDADCKYKGATYSSGAQACQSGSKYRCDDGEWTGLAIPCSDNPAAAAKGCILKGTPYSAGATSCQSGSQYRCDDGSWVSLAAICTADAQLGARPAASARSCMFNGATVGTDSTICKSGVTFRCDDGEWRNLGTACQ